METRRSLGSAALAAAFAAALAALAAPPALAAQEVEVDASLRGFWRWALADVAGGQELSAGRKTVKIPAPPGTDIDAAARRGPPAARGRRGGRGRGGKAGGPSFCRSGVGHPVWGRRWCLEKGFGLGPVPWDRVDLGDIIFGDGRHGDRLGLGELLEVLGREALEVILGRADAGDGRDVTGRWQQVEGSDARVLQLRVGVQPLAELNDLDGDGRVDAALVFEGGL